MTHDAQPVTGGENIEYQTTSQLALTAAAGYAYENQGGSVVTFGPHGERDFGRGLCDDADHSAGSNCLRLEVGAGVLLTTEEDNRTTYVKRPVFLHEVLLSASLDRRFHNALRYHADFPVIAPGMFVVAGVGPHLETQELLYGLQSLGEAIDVSAEVGLSAVVPISRGRAGVFFLRAGVDELVQPLADERRPSTYVLLGTIGAI